MSKSFVKLKAMKKFIIPAITLVILILAGLFIPLGSYTTTYGCQLNTMPTARLHMIRGDSLNEVKNRKDPIGAGCTVNTKYVLYLL